MGETGSTGACGRREGIAGELAAAEYLKAKGYKILGMNFKSRYGEIDIIAQNGACLIFVEVKSRLGLGYGRPIEAVTPLKAGRIRKTAEYYTVSKNLLDRDLRFDVVEILRDEITHTENAF